MSEFIPEASELIWRAKESARKAKNLLPANNERAQGWLELSNAYATIAMAVQAVPTGVVEGPAAKMIQLALDFAEEAERDLPTRKYERGQGWAVLSNAYATIAMAVQAVPTGVVEDPAAEMIQLALDCAREAEEDLPTHNYESGHRQAALSNAYATIAVAMRA